MPETLERSGKLPPRRSALAGCLVAGQFGSATSNYGGVTLTERMAVTIHQIDVPSSVSPDGLNSLGHSLHVTFPPAPGTWTGDDKAAVASIGPGKFYLLGRELSDFSDVLEASENAGAAAFDLGHARTCIRISGDKAAAVLARGTGVDLHESSFGNNGVAMTGLFHIAATIINRSDVGGYDILVARGFAQSLWEHLTLAASSFGYTVKDNNS